MRTIFVMIGIPGSGKSTYANELLERNGWPLVRINRDDLRNMFSLSQRRNYCQQGSTLEKFIFDTKFKLLKNCIDNGMNVILDDTHVTSDNVKKIHKFARERGDILVIEIHMNTPVEECIERDSKREGFARVGEEVIRNFAKKHNAYKDKNFCSICWKQFYYPKVEDIKVDVSYNHNLPLAIMCDLDGTFALVGDRSPYDASKCDELDKPNWPVIEVVKRFAQDDFKIIFMSGRSEKYRNQTKKFIERFTDCHYNLIMRSEGDNRKDSIVKQELFKKFVHNVYNVEFVLDDRSSVVDMWRKIGLTCFQVAPGDF